MAKRNSREIPEVLETVVRNSKTHKAPKKKNTMKHAVCDKKAETVINVTKTNPDKERISSSFIL